MFPDSSYSQQHSICGFITNWGEDLVKILPFNLSKAFGYEECFEFVKAAISVRLHFENPFLACWELSEFQDASFHQCVYLSVHRFFPLGRVRSYDSFCHLTRFWRLFSLEEGCNVSHVEKHNHILPLLDLQSQCSDFLVLLLHFLLE